jgi:protein-disulfide isomerase
MVLFVLWFALAGAPGAQARGPKSRPTPAPAPVQQQVAPSQAPAPSTTRVEESCECELQRPDTAAVVNGFRISMDDLDRFTAGDVGSVRAQMDALRAQGLQVLINQKLIEQEARRRGTTSTRLLQSEIYEKVPNPSEDEVRLFFERNRASLQGEYDQVRVRLIEYVRGQREGIQLTLLTEGLRGATRVEVIDAAPSAPAKVEDRARVVAIVGDEKITLGDVEASVRSNLYQGRRQIYEVQRLALELMVDGALVEQEANRRNVTFDAFIAAEVQPKAHKVDNFDATKFYNENKAQFQGQQLADVRDDIIKFLQQAANTRALHDYALGLRKGATVQINLVEPAPPNYVIDIAGRPAKGSASAPVTIVEFGDFQCPRCATAFKTLEEVAKTYGDKVRIVARHFPLEQHLHALKAAEASEAANEQGKFWEYAALLYANQQTLSVDKLKEYATQVGLDRAKFDAALDSGRFAPSVSRDAADGLRIAISSTPAIFVNGKLLFDDSMASVKAAIDAELAGKK